MAKPAGSAASLVDWGRVRDVVVERVRSGMRGFAAEDIEEVSQDVLVSLVGAARARWDPDEIAFEDLARNAARRGASNFRKKVARRAERLFAIPEVPLEKRDSPLLDEQLDRTSVRQRLRALLAEDPELRELFLWIVRGEGRPQVLSFLLGRPVSVIKNEKRRLLARAKRLRRELI